MRATSLFCVCWMWPPPSTPSTMTFWCPDLSVSLACVVSFSSGSAPICQTGHSKSCTPAVRRQWLALCALYRKYPCLVRVCLLYTRRTLLMSPRHTVSTPTHTKTSARTLVHAFVTNRVDGNNAMLAGSPRTVTYRVQCVLNAAARIVSGNWKFDRGLTHLLHSELHWLDVPEHIQHKLGVTVHRCLQGKAPQYLIECCTPTSKLPSPAAPFFQQRHAASISVSLPSVSQYWDCGAEGLQWPAPCSR